MYIKKIKRLGIKTALLLGLLSMSACISGNRWVELPFDKTQLVNSIPINFTPKGYFNEVCFLLRNKFSEAELLRGLDMYVKFKDNKSPRLNFANVLELRSGKKRFGCFYSTSKMKGNIDHVVISREPDFPVSTVVWRSYNK